MRPGPMKDYLHMYEVAENGCWHFTGFVDPRSGYGSCRGTGAHRYFYTHLVGEIPAGLQIDHICHDPRVCPGGTSCLHRRCVNPDHLAPATARDNVLRSNSFVAKFSAATHCPYGHEYAGENLVIRPHQRTCRECERRRWREHHAAQREVVAVIDALTPLQLVVLKVIATEPKDDFALAEATGLARQTVSRVRGELVRGGLVARAGERQRAPHRRPTTVWKAAA